MNSLEINNPEAERQDVSYRANTLAQHGYIGTAQELVDQYNHKYKLGQYAVPNPPEPAQQQQHRQNQQKAEQLMKRIYQETLDTQPQNTQTPVPNNTYTPSPTIDNSNPSPEFREKYRLVLAPEDKETNPPQNLEFQTINNNFGYGFNLPAYVELRKIAQDIAPDVDMKRLNDELNMYRKSPHFDYMYNQAVKNGPTISNIQLQSDLNGALGGYNPKTKSISFKGNDQIYSAALEEFIHSQQDNHYPDMKNPGDNYRNYEFEAKLLENMIEFEADLTPFYPIQSGDNGRYAKWIENTVGFPSRYPSYMDIMNKNNEMNYNYWNGLDYFSKHAEGYKGPYNPEQLPEFYRKIYEETRKRQIPYNYEE